jgi:hypothetical protein
MSELSDDPGTRTVFHWIGTDASHQRDIEALADVLAGTGELFCQESGMVQLGAGGELLQVNFEGFRRFIDEHVCSMRVVKQGDKWVREFYLLTFPEPIRFDPLYRGPPKPPPPRTYGPSSKDLEELYRHLVRPKLPRVE